MAENSRWRISESISDEIDAALSLAFAESFRQIVPSFGEMTETLHDEWYTQGRELLRGLAGDFFSVLSRLAAPLGLVENGDYSQVSMRLREASAADIEEASIAAAADAGLDLTAGQGPAQTLERLVLAQRKSIGFEFAEGGEGARLLRRESEMAIAITRGGPHHARFWHWVDRFFYETYQPWRETRQAFMDQERARAEAGLKAGGEEMSLAWLPRQNPLNRKQLLFKQARYEDIDLVFWVEPFGLWDMIGHLPNGLLVSFGVPGESFEKVRDKADALGGRLKALADPTRLSILRIVRQLEVDNSEIADYLEVSHPTVSVHAKTLRKAGLIHCRREGRRLLHRIDPDAIRQLMRELESFLGLPPE